MKILNSILFLLFVLSYAANGQAHIELSIANTSTSNAGATWTFELRATAQPTYTGNDNQFQGMNARFDVAVGMPGVTVTGGSAIMNPTYTGTGGVQGAVPGAPPANSTEFGVSVARNPSVQLDIPIGLPVTLGTYTINFSAPVSPSSIVTPRTGTTTSGSFWANAIPGLRPFIMPAPFPLPVKLISFDAEKVGERSVKLDWTTAIEINSDYYGVERSVDGQAWENIGYVKAAGNSEVKLDYTFTDSKLPLRRTGEQLFYYRLLMMDIDGVYNYSDIRGVNFYFDGEGLVSVYPNPTTERINVNLSKLDFSNELVELTMFDMDGRLLLKKEVIGSGIELINTDILSAGAYNLVIRQGDFMYQQKVIKVD